MKNFIAYFKANRDTALLSSAMLLLLLAMFEPSIPLKHNIYSYFLVADISQSMNAVDMRINGKPVSRIAYSKKLLHETVASLPCDTKVSIGLFAGNSVAALYTPIEVCENFDAIQDTIDHLDWRNAWSGNSRVRESLYSIARAVRGFPEPAQVVMLTDGEEAPKLHAFNTRDLTNFQGADGWLLVGVGSEKGTAIPKLTEKNQLIGYWSNDSFALQPGIAQISESTLGTRDDNVAGANDRFISKLDSEYLRNVAREIGGNYVAGDNLHQVLDAMKKQKPARRDIAPYNLSSVLAGLAAWLLLMACMGKQPVAQIKTRLKFYKKEFLKQRVSENENRIAHDNHIN